MTGKSSEGKRKRSRSPVNGLGEEEPRRQCLRERLQETSERAEETPLPDLTNEDRISAAKSALREHMGIGGEERHRPRAVVLFFVELTPYSSRRGATCRHTTCDDLIEQGAYRIAVHPGMNNVYQSPGKTRSVRAWLG